MSINSELIQQIPKFLNELNKRTIQLADNLKNEKE
jgi:hypothetical protein